MLNDASIRVGDMGFVFIFGRKIARLPNLCAVEVSKRNIEGRDREAV